MKYGTSDVDIVVAGGGVVGMTLALAAARAGLSCALVDRAAPNARAVEDFDGRAYALAAASVRLFTALGVWPDIAAEAQPMRRIEVFDGRIGAVDGPLLSFEGAEIEAAPFAALIEDRFLRRALLDAVAAEPLIERRAPAGVAEARADEAGATATLEDGSAIRAALVAACDGRGSALAAAAGLGATRGRYDQTGLVCAVGITRPHEGVARQIFYPGGPFAMLPLRGDRASIVWSERTDAARRIAALDDAAYLREIAHRSAGLLGDVSLEGGRWAYPLSLSLAYDYVAPRLALVGDAAHGMHPIAGQGFNIGLRDVAALVETLAEARRRGEDVGEAAALARYQRWRRFDGASFAAATDGLARLFSNDNALLRGLRDIGLGVVNRLPGLKRAFMAEAAGVSGDLPRLLRGEAP